MITFFMVPMFIWNTFRQKSFWPRKKKKKIVYINFSYLLFSFPKKKNREKQFKSPTNSQQEVSCQEKRKNDESQEWKIIVHDQHKEMGPLVVGQPFTLYHPLTKTSLQFNGKDFVVRYIGGIFPSYQKEVGASTSDHKNVTYWFVNRIYEKQLLDEEFLFVDDWKE